MQQKMRRMETPMKNVEAAKAGVKMVLKSWISNKNCLTIIVEKFRVSFLKCLKFLTTRSNKIKEERLINLKLSLAYDAHLRVKELAIFVEAHPSDARAQLGIPDPLGLVEADDVHDEEADGQEAPTDAHPLPVPGVSLVIHVAVFFGVWH